MNLTQFYEYQEKTFHLDRQTLTRNASQGCKRELFVQFSHELPYSALSRKEIAQLLQAVYTALVTQHRRCSGRRRNLSSPKIMRWPRRFNFPSRTRVIRCCFTSSNIVTAALLRSYTVQQIQFDCGDAKHSSSFAKS